MKKSWLLFPLLFGLSLSAAAQPSTVIPTRLSRLWQDDVTNFASLPTGIFPGEKHMALDTRTLWVWTCTVSGMTQTCDWEPGAVGQKGDHGDKGDPGDPGVSGANGNTVRSGTGAPSSGTGVNGDFYVDTNSLTIYGPKTAGAWGSGTALIGTPGAPGSNGLDGVNGVNGATWTTGSGAPTGGSDGDLYLRSTGDVYRRATGAWGIIANITGPPGSNGNDGAPGPAGPSPSGAANLVLATPDGTPGVAALRALTAAYIPALPYLPSSTSYAAASSPGGPAVAALTAGAFDHTPSPCGASQFVTGISAAGVLTCGAAPLAHARVVIVDSSASGNDATIPLYTTLSAALTYVAAQTPAVITPWTIQLYPGAAGVGADNSNYQESGNLVVPIQTVIQGISLGVLGASASLNASPTIKLTCPSGTCLRLTGGDTLRDVTIQYKGAPTAAVTVVALDNSSSGSTQAVNLYNVFVSVSPTNSSFAVDGVANNVSSSYMGYTDIQMSGGSTANRALVNNDTLSSRGITVVNSRFSGQTGCLKLIENVAAGAINLLYSRPDKKCTCDLSNVGTGAFTAFATPYSVSCGSGLITSFGPTELDGGNTIPTTCHPRQSWMDTTAAAERLCLCSAAGAWLCKAFP